MKTKFIKQTAQEGKPNHSMTRLVVPQGQWLAAWFALAIALLWPASLYAIVNGMVDTRSTLENADAPVVVESDSGCEADKMMKPDQVVQSRVASAKSEAVLESTSVHVASVDTLRVRRPSIAGRNSSRYNSQATVIIVDDLDQPVAGARVAGTFTGNYLDKSHTVSGTTESDGSVTLELKKSVTKVIDDPPVTFTFCVDEVQASLPYHPADNVMTCDTAP